MGVGWLSTVAGLKWNSRDGFDDASVPELAEGLGDLDVFRRTALLVDGERVRLTWASEGIASMV